MNNEATLGFMEKKSSFAFILTENAQVFCEINTMALEVGQNIQLFTHLQKILIQLANSN